MSIENTVISHALVINLTLIGNKIAYIVVFFLHMKMTDYDFCTPVTVAFKFTGCPASRSANSVYAVCGLVFLICISLTTKKQF